MLPLSCKTTTPPRAGSPFWDPMENAASYPSVTPTFMFGSKGFGGSMLSGNVKMVSAIISVHIFLSIFNSIRQITFGAENRKVLICMVSNVNGNQSVVGNVQTLVCV